MPIIDVDLPEGVIPAARREQLANDLGRALLAAEGLPARGPILASVAVYLHAVPRGDIYTLAGTDNPPPVRVRLTTAAGSLDTNAQGQVVGEITRIVAEAAEDPSLTARILCCTARWRRVAGEPAGRPWGVRTSTGSTQP
jgi:phenylpyruvate tautomerase PptA (4-oxalocrotonate tautomerase family)